MKAKRWTALVLGVLCCGAVAACEKEAEETGNSFTELKSGQTLVVGGEKYLNIVDEETEKDYLTYVSCVTYTLIKTTYGFENCVEYKGSYYYWKVEEIKDEHYLGISTNKYTIQYSYLEYGEKEENIAIKRKLIEEKTVSYKGGWISLDRKVEIELNGYFVDVSALKVLSSELYEQIDNSTENKYYVDVTTPSKVTIDYENYPNTYYYFE